MAHGKLLRQLIRSGVEGDLAAFRGVAKQVIDEERQKHHHLLANDLETILYGRARTPSSPALRNLAATIPEDRERGLRLLVVREPVRRLEDVVLSRENLSLVREILFEHNREEVLRSHGLRPSDPVLFCGPPGCGKTLTAEVIAGELGRPLAIVRTDSVVSSFLGETAANLRKVFDFVAAHRMVALFDEFDALGKEREDASEHGELRRVVNAVLQMFDAYDGRSLVVAATNHEDLLDTAIWRRFEEVLLLTPPTEAQLCQLFTGTSARSTCRRGSGWSRPSSAPRFNSWTQCRRLPGMLRESSFLTLDWPRAIRSWLLQSVMLRVFSLVPERTTNTGMERWCPASYSMTTLLIVFRSVASYRSCGSSAAGF